MSDSQYKDILSRHKLLYKITETQNTRRKVAAVLFYLESRGKSPKIDRNVLRDIEIQKKIVAAGHSQTLNSQHLPGKDGLSRAADIVDNKTGWGSGFDLEFQKLIGRIAIQFRLGWGGLFGFSEQRKIILIKKLLDDKQFNKISRSELSWDTAHVQQQINWPVTKIFGGK